MYRSKYIDPFIELEMATYTSKLLSRGQILVQMAREKYEHKDLENNYKIQGKHVERVPSRKNSDVTLDVKLCTEQNKTHDMNTMQSVNDEQTVYCKRILQTEQTRTLLPQNKQLDTCHDTQIGNIDKVCYDDTDTVADGSVQARDIPDERPDNIPESTCIDQEEHICCDRNTHVRMNYANNHQASSTHTQVNVEVISEVEGIEVNSESEYDDSDKDPDWEPDKKRDRIESDSSEDESMALINKRKKKKTVPIVNLDKEDNTPQVIQEEVVQTSKRKRSKSSVKRDNEQKRMSGKNYLGVKKGRGYCSQRPGRILVPRSCSTACLKGKGGRKCFEITDEFRNETFQAFWGEMNWDEKRVYAISLVKKVSTSRPSKQNSRRQNTYIYYLKVAGENVRVCKEMFLSTLGVKEDMVNGWLNTDPNNDGIPKRKPTDNKVNRNNTGRELGTKFLNSLPKLPSHYCRQETSKHYLETNLSTFTDVYNMYKQQLRSDGVETQYVLGKTIFQELFNEMNLALFEPKKDQCDLCVGYKAGNVNEEVYNAHVKRKDEARQSKANDKIQAALNKKQIVLTMDVQSILLCPKLEANCMYYKTKLCCHNFPMFDLVSKECACYFWTEIATDLAATTFTSCIVHYLEGLDLAEIDRITLYSDGCAYQNRNVTLANALSFFAKQHSVIVEQKYLERGHTQMECDSIHAHIETKLKNKDIHVPSQYVEVMKSARPKQPYKVRYCDHTFFKDYTKITEYTSIRPGVGVGSAVVADIRQLQYQPDGTIKYKLSYDCADYGYIRKPRQSSANANLLGEVPSLRTRPLPIKKPKYEHLQQMKSVIPKDYHSFYDNLNHS